MLYQILQVMRCDLYLARQVVLRAIHSESVEDLVLEILKRLAEHTDNEIDDVLVEQLKLAMYSRNKDKVE